MQSTRQLNNPQPTTNNQQPTTNNHFYLLIFNVTKETIMQLIDFLNEKDRFAKSIGAQLTELREGYSRAELTVEERHLNGADVCQGGVIYTLADLAFAGVANGHGLITLGINNSITILKSALLGDTIIAEATEVVNHHRLPYCDIKISNQNGDIIAIMTGLGYRLKKEFPGLKGNE